ncbi:MULTISPECIES: acetyl-CoA carboxylase biotin carboxyl carrier protein [Bacillaceae]|uniref:Biotin carboxyl carrier protein of acetyl-CoA carboxylase n=1 Tax=Peribacillus huizhouensis TaxID=1501239 RepID=A0ABR6CR49_9BACI|nr:MULTISPECIES: acetyl-CoA carboxylase biotin carboxyl carrier protein [Bacillaceae]MBA9027386.1 acetyl-CoA carboxylase biotin carboxyl carrier protein [Peribacillus huizhouensis]
MLKVQEIQEIIKLVDQSSINEFVFEQEGTKITLKKAVQEQAPQVVYQATPAVQSVAAMPTTNVPQETPKQVELVTDAEANNQENLHKITSPMVGTFYASASPEAGPYVKLGSKVGNDSIVCIVEAMKLFNEIEAEVSGEIVEILVQDGQLVEYGQPLFLVKPE